MAAQTVEQYIKSHPNWENELNRLREILLSTELQEEIKWSAPVYTLQNKNVVGLAAFNNHCSLWFFQGALLKENTALLQNVQEGKTKALRQIKFVKGVELPLKKLRLYIVEAIKNQKEGKEIKTQRNKKVQIPAELSTAFQNDASLETSFEDLTPGRQREYCEYIESAKRQKTKMSRIEKISPMIKSGIGLNDRYKK